MTGPRKLKVLIIEDETIVAMSVRLLLEMDGNYEVVGIADDVQSTIHIAAANAPDLALVDIQLARGASGLDVATRLQQKGIPCLFMTSNPPALPRPDLALGVICKPFGDEALFQALAISRQILSDTPVKCNDLPSEFRLYTSKA